MRRHRKLIRFLLFPLIVFTLLLSTSVGIVKISGDSMKPALQDGDYVFYYRQFKEVTLGDIILFERNGEKFIKRVYGIPGDSVEITKKEILLINGVPPVIDDLAVQGTTFPRDLKNKLTLKQNEYFVLGDYRSISLDSRNKEIGKVLFHEIIGVLPS